MVRPLVKTSKFVIGYTSADNNVRRRARTRMDNYLKEADISLPVLAEQLSELLGVKYDRKSAKGLLDYLEYPEKDKELIAQAKRNAGKNAGSERAKRHLKELKEQMSEQGLTKSSFKKIWENCSFSEIEKEYGFSQNDSWLLAKSFNLGEKPNSQYEYTYKDLYKELLEKGETASSIKVDYIDNLMTLPSLINKFEKLVGREVGEKRTIKLLTLLGINRTQQQLRYQQGRKSRKVKNAAIERFERSGYTLASMAKRYEEDYSLTKRKIIKELNSHIVDGEDPFTERWLARHLDPLLSKVRLGGVSRSELEFYTEITKLFPKEKIETSVRTLIPPKEVDIYFPERRIAIEFNGDYWHSDKFILPNHGITADEYHKIKKRECKEKGVELYFVWESDWAERDKEVLDEIVSIFKKENNKNLKLINKT